MFAPSPRRLTPAAARALIAVAAAQPPAVAAGERRVSAAATNPPLTVGVFGDLPAGEIAAVVEEVGLDGVQLHDPAGPGAGEVRAALSARHLSPLVVKAVPVGPKATSRGAIAELIAAASEEADIVLLDTRSAERFGGTGAVFPWALAREAGKGIPLLVAGGIGPDNAKAALGESGAWGVDVSSGVERSPGMKDAALMSRLLAQVCAADQRQEGLDK